MSTRSRKQRAARRGRGPVQRDAAAASPRPRRRPRTVAAFLFLLCLACYLVNERTLPHPLAGDSQPNRLLPFSMLAFGTVTLDPFRADFARPDIPKWPTVEQRGHLVSIYPIGASVLSVPIYAPYQLWLRARGPLDAGRLFAAAPVAEKAAAATIAALAAGLLYLVLRRFAPPKQAFWTALAFGLGTSMWATASQLLWQHGPLVLAIVAGLYFLTWPERPAWCTALAGLALAMAFATRPTGALFLAAGLTAVAVEPRPWRDRLREALAYAGGAAPVLAGVLAYNLTFFGRPLGWYQGLELAPSRIPVALAGLLLSPNRGLLVFTPIALVGIVGLARAFRHPARAPLLVCFGAAACGDLLIHASYREWAAGWSFGPRYAVDVLPVLALAAAGQLADLPRRLRVVLAIGLVWSILVQLNGAFCYPASRWNERVGRRDIQKAAWSFRRFALWEDFVAWRRQPYLAAPY